MELLVIFIIIPIGILVGSFVLTFKYLYIGSAISAVIATFYFYGAWTVMTSLGRPNGGGGHLSLIDHWKEILIFGVAYLCVFLFISFIKSNFKA